VPQRDGNYKIINYLFIIIYNYKIIIIKLLSVINFLCKGQVESGPRFAQLSLPAPFLLLHATYPTCLFMAPCIFLANNLTELLFWGVLLLLQFPLFHDILLSHKIVKNVFSSLYPWFPTHFMSSHADHQ
jgi:hypothetical protein